MANPNPEPDDGPDLTLLQKFPVLLLGAIGLVVTIVLNIVVDVGIPVSEALQDDISKLVDAVGAVVILVLLYRRTVSSAKVINRVTNSGEVVAGEAAVEPTGSTVVLAQDHATGLPVPLSTVNPALVTQESVPAADLTALHHARREPPNKGSLFD